MTTLDCLEDISLKKWTSEIEADEVGCDAAITSHDAGQIGKCISQQKKFIDCKELLTDTDHIPGLESNKPSSGISESWWPICSQAVLLCYLCFRSLDFNQLPVHESTRQQFLCFKN